MKNSFKIFATRLTRDSRTLFIQSYILSHIILGNLYLGKPFSLRRGNFLWCQLIHCMFNDDSVVTLQWILTFYNSVINVMFVEQNSIVLWKTHSNISLHIHIYEWTNQSPISWLNRANWLCSIYFSQSIT